MNDTKDAVERCSRQNNQGALLLSRTDRFTIIHHKDYLEVHEYSSLFCFVAIFPILLEQTIQQIYSTSSVEK